MVGRKRAGQISRDRFPQEYENKEPGLCWQREDSSACESWQRRPWHLLHPGSLERWRPVAPGKEELHSHLYFDLQCFNFSMRKTQQEAKVHFPFCQRTTVERRAELPDGRGELAGRDGTVNLGMRHSWLLFPIVLWSREWKDIWPWVSFLVFFFHQVLPH